jgi:drug/metabolite transporter (DMT)-like permease
VTTAAVPSASHAHGRHPAAPLAAASAAAIVWGIGPLFVRAIGTSGLTVATYRMGFGIPAMFILLRIQRGRMSMTIMRTAAPAGVLFAANIALGFSSFQHTSIADATLLEALTPLLVLGVSRKMFGEQLRRVDFIWFAAAAAGTIAVVVGGQPGGNQALSGDLLALAATVVWTVYFLYVKQVRLDGVPAFAFMTAVITTGFIALLPFALLSGDDLGSVRGTDFVWLFCLILGPGAMGHGLMTWATRYVNVNVTSLMTLAGPVVSTVGAYFAFDESLSITQVLGGAVVLGALTMVLLGHRPGELEPVPPEGV